MQPAILLPTVDCFMLTSRCLHTSTPAMCCLLQCTSEHSQNVCSSRNQNWYQGQGAHFLQVPKSIWTRKAITKISNLKFTGLFFSHIFNMNKVSLHAKFHAYTLLVFLRYRQFKMAFQARKVFVCLLACSCLVLYQPFSPFLS